ncbi:MAG: DUF1874 domain-containing protein [Rugosibacter sp.]|nr:DUF1874 domain-containing protein [Rugosibacter sp.]
MLYLLNSAVVTTPGIYRYRLCDREEAVDLLRRADWVSTIGYEETAKALSTLSGIDIPCPRTQIYMDAGDEGLVFRLTVRLADPAVKGRINDPEWIIDHCEMGILTKLED